MSDIYKLQYGGMTLAYPGWNGYVCYEKPAGYPITYLSDDHVSVTGDSIYIPGSEGITLQSSYDTYYRISGYDITNGSIVDGKLVPTGPCTIKAVQKVNAFTASGSYVLPSKYNTASPWNVTFNAIAKTTYKTSNIPTSWSSLQYSRTYTSRNTAVSYTGGTVIATTNVTAWNPKGTISAYNFKNNANLNCTHVDSDGSVKVFTGCFRYNNTDVITGKAACSNGQTKTITLTANTTNLGYYQIFCHKMREYASNSLSNNSWVATGIAP